MRFVFRKGREAPLLVIGLLAASFILLGVTFKPALAVTPTVSNDGSSDSGAAASTTTTMTIANIGDTIVVFAEALSLDATFYTISSVTSTAVSGGFTELNSVTAYCIGAVGFCSGVGINRPNFESVWVGVATASGVGKNIVATGSGTVSNDIGEQVYDISNAAATPALTVTGFCNANKNQDCGNPIVTSQSVSPQLASVYVAGALAIGSTLASAGSQMTYVGGANPTAGVFAQNTLVPPTNFPVNFNGNTGLNTGFVIIGLVFNTASVTTVTTVINTACLGACSGGNNGTAQYLPPPTTTFFSLHFYASQNLALAAQIDNVTVKVGAVHITTNTGTLYVLVYRVTGVPSGGNQYSLLTSVPVQISNGTSNFFIHANPQSNLAANDYYAVGVMSTTTASRGSGASGSGVSLYETSQSGITEYKFAVGSATPPTSFFSSLVQTPRDFLFIHSTFTVGTVTSTTTLTQSGLVTSTTTVTTTSTNVVNQLDMSKAGFWFLPMLFLILPMGLLIMVKRISDGR